MIRGVAPRCPTPSRCQTLLQLGAVLLLAACSGTASATTSQTSACILTLRIGARSESPPGQFHADLIFENKKIWNTSCRLSGFPDVELIGPVAPVYGSLYELPDQSGRSESVTLRPGSSAHALLTWLPSSSVRGSWTPGYVRVTVPTGSGTSDPMALPWRFGSVLRQDAATHPGSYIGPIRPGAG